MQSNLVIVFKELLVFTSAYAKYRRVGKFFKRWAGVIIAKHAVDMSWSSAVRALAVSTDTTTRKAALLAIWKKICATSLYNTGIALRLLKIIFHPKLVAKRFILAVLLQLFLIGAYRFSKILNHVFRKLIRSKEHELRSRLNRCQSYEEWAKIAKQLDELTGNESWKLDKKSPYFDHRLIESKTKYCGSLVAANDVEAVMWHLRKGLLRRQGGVGHEELYRQCFIGTKYVVEEYISTICDALRFVLAYETPRSDKGEKQKDKHDDREVAEQSEHEGESSESSDTGDEDGGEGGAGSSSGNGGLVKSFLDRRWLFGRARSNSGEILPRHLHYRQDDGSSKITLHHKLIFFKETRHSLGKSALLLSGGITLGLYHLGVVKALFEQNLLPRVISGSSAGSIIASSLCCKTNDEIPELFTMGYLDLNFFERIETISKENGIFASSFFRRTKRLVTKGNLLDITVLRDTIRANLGDMTFREAYERTGRILNISVTPRSKTEYPTILNYLTAPHVLIWSACLASCAIPLVFESVVLMAKDKAGNVEPYYPEGLKWQDGSLEFDLPMTRLSELFNVNHFIVSQVNPHVIPFSTIGWGGNVLTKLLHFVKSDLQNYWANLVELGLPVPFFNQFFGVVTQKYTGDITIKPLKLTLRNFKGLLSNPTHEKVQEAILEGQRKTWPFISMVKTHCDIEFTLDECVAEVERRMLVLSGEPGLGRLRNSPSMDFPFDEAKELTS